MKKQVIILILVLMGILTYAQNQHYSLTWKNFNIHSTALEEIGKLATKAADGTGNSYWSVGCETLDRDYAIFSEYKQYVGELGVGYARIQSGWEKCEKEKGRYDFRWLDEVVDGLNEQGVRPWMCLCYGNSLYGTGRNLGASLFSEDYVMNAWCKYVSETVKHYMDRVAMWEVWNEPNLSGRNKPELYAELLIRTAEEIRRADHDAVIYAFGLSGMPLDYTKSVMDILKRRGKLHLINKVTFHPYYPNPDDATADIIALRELVKSYSTDIDIYQGETGCPSILEYGHALSYREWTEYSQVKWNLRRMANDFRMSIPSSIFTLVDLQYDNMLQSFGLIRMNLLKKVVYKRPSFYGVQHMANLLTTEVKPVELVIESGSSREISVVGLADKSGDMVGAMLWYCDKVPSNTLEKDLVNVTINGLSLKNAVYVEPITGRVYDLSRVVLRGGKSGGNLKFTDLPIWDSPVFIMERSHVKFRE